MTEAETRVAVTADLDVPGETGRQARVFAVWLFCLALAVAVGSAVGAHVSAWDRDTAAGQEELARSRAAKLKVAVSVGLVLPGLLTWAIGYRYRRGGGHARGIVVDVTSEGELRLWGRGYGSRLPLAGATATERVVDVYAGRLGAWRQRRLRVVRGSRTAARGGVAEIEIATRAVPSDMEQGMRHEGGEGDCVELEREDYELVRAAVLAEIARTTA